MGIEIDMLKVGDGDAIALRYVSPDGENFVAVIDGGYQDDGPKLASIVRSYYQRSYVDLVVSTHPDQDHISGLRTLIDNIEVRRVWVHQPLQHQQGISVAVAKEVHRQLHIIETEILCKSLDQQSDFISAVNSLRIKTEEPFAGDRNCSTAR